MDKIILVFYINTRSLTDEETYERLSNFKEIIDHNKQDGMMYYILPTTEFETRIECLNPKLISQEEYNFVQSKLDKLNKILDNFLTNNQ